MTFKTMCDVFGADTTTQAIWQSRNPRTSNLDRHQVDLNLAIGFPPKKDYAEVKQDHKRLMRAAMVPLPEKRIPVTKDSCTIL